MKKKNIIIIAILFVAILTVIFSVKHMLNNSSENEEYVTIWEDIDVSDVERIEIYNGSDLYKISDAEDIDVILDYVHNMRVRQIEDDEKAGWAFTIDLYLINSDKHHIVMRSGDMHVDSVCYESKNIYVDWLYGFLKITDVISHY